MQSINVDVRKVKQNAALAITALESFRSDESFDAVWQLAEQRSETAKDIIDEEVILEWGKKASKKYVSKELSQEIQNKAGYN